MNCQEADELVDALVDGELDETSRASMEAHVTQCATCAEQVQGRRNLGGLLNQTLVAAAAVPVDFEDVWGAVEAGIADANPSSVSSHRSGATRSRTAGGSRSAGRASRQQSRRSASQRPGGRPWRVPAVSAGAIAVAALAFVFLTTESETDPSQVVAAGAEPGVLGTITPRPSPRLLASSRREGAVLGPVSPSEETLASDWPPQVQPGPVQVSSHANAVWRQRSAR